MADSCAWEADAAILPWITTVREVAIRERWDPERAHGMHLEARGVKLLREPLPSCLLEYASCPTRYRRARVYKPSSLITAGCHCYPRASSPPHYLLTARVLAAPVRVRSLDGSCRLRGELALSIGAIPNLLATMPQLCGAYLLTDPRTIHTTCARNRTVVADAAMREADPGFCELERTCGAAARALPRICLADGSIVEHGMLLAATAPCMWEEPLWWAPGVEKACASNARLVDSLRTQSDGGRRDTYGEAALDGVELVVVRGNGEDTRWTAPLGNAVELVHGSQVHAPTPRLSTWSTIGARGLCY